MVSDVAPSHAADARTPRRTSESYRLKAAECRDRAASASDAATRVNYLELAEYWNDMARDAENLGQLRSRT